MSIRQILTGASAVLLILATVSPIDAGKGKRSKQTQSLSLDEADWSLEIDLPRFKIEERATRPDGSGTMLRGASRKTEMIASVFLERNPELSSKEECKEHYWSKAMQGPFPKSNVEFISTETMEQVHHFVKEYKGIALMQKSVNAFMYRDDVCVDVHLSKVLYESKDAELFTAILDTVRFSEESQE